jgi:hypothetical protein
VTAYCHVFQFEFEMGHIDHIQVAITNHYNTVINFHTLEITTEHANSFQSAAIFFSRSLVTVCNSGDCLAAPTKFSLQRFLCY